MKVGYTVRMRTLREAMGDALAHQRALGHFNISDSTQLHAIARAARDVNVPVIIGMSEGERDFAGLRAMVALVEVLRKNGHEIYTNADHTHTVEGCKEAIDAGCDSVIFDGSKLSMEENIAHMQEVVAYAAASERDVIIEGEVGYIGTSSKMLEDVPDDVVAAALPSAEEVAAFASNTGAGAVAPAVGNLHGMLKGMSNPALNIELIHEIRSALGNDVGMVLHGGSGITDEDFRAAIAAGMNVVHINTEIRKAYREGVETALQDNPDEIAPYRYLNKGEEAVYQVVKDRLTLFSNL